MSIAILMTKDENAVFNVSAITNAVRGEPVEP